MLLKLLRKMLSTQLINNVRPVREVVQQKVPNLLNVIIVLDEVKLDLIKAFLQYNKHVLNAVGMVKRLVNHVTPAVVMVKSKPMKM